MLLPPQGASYITGLQSLCSDCVVQGFVGTQLVPLVLILVRAACLAKQPQGASCPTAVQHDAAAAMHARVTKHFGCACHIHRLPLAVCFLVGWCLLLHAPKLWQWVLEPKGNCNKLPHSTATLQHAAYYPHVLLVKYKVALPACVRNAAFHRHPFVP